MNRMLLNLFFGLALAVSGGVSTAKAQPPVDEHGKLAGYYRERAERAWAESKKHDLEADGYKQHPTADGVKNPMAYRTEAHCRYLAEKYRKSAMHFEAQAAAQERMAGIPVKAASGDHKPNPGASYCAGDSCCSGSSCSRNRKAA